MNRKGEGSESCRRLCTDWIKLLSYLSCLWFCCTGRGFIFDKWMFCVADAVFSAWHSNRTGTPSRSRKRLRVEKREWLLLVTSRVQGETKGGSYLWTVLRLSEMREKSESAAYWRRHKGPRKVQWSLRFWKQRTRTWSGTRRYRMCTWWYGTF